MEITEVNKTIVKLKRDEVKEAILRYLADEGKKFVDEDNVEMSIYSSPDVIIITASTEMVRA